MEPCQEGSRSAGLSVDCEPDATALAASSTPAPPWPRSTEPVSLLRHSLLDEIVDHRGAGLRALADHDRGLCADLASLGLPVAETAHVGNRRARSDHRVAGVDLRRAGMRLCCELPVGNSASTSVSQNAILNKKNMSLSRSYATPRLFSLRRMAHQ